MLRRPAAGKVWCLPHWPGPAGAVPGGCPTKKSRHFCRLLVNLVSQLTHYQPNAAPAPTWLSPLLKAPPTVITARSEMAR